MTISTLTAQVTYAGDGVRATFPTTFQFLENSHIAASLWATDSGLKLADWTEGTEYNLTGAGEPNGGDLVVVTSPTDYRPQTGQTLLIALDIPKDQQVALPLAGPLPSPEIETALDKLTQITQQNERDASFSLTLPPTSEVSNTSLPLPKPREGFRWEDVDSPQQLLGYLAQTIHTVSGDPPDTLGENGDYAVDDATRLWYGPKAGGTWPPGVFLGGQDGTPGEDGSIWYGGEPEPAAGLGKVADWYLRRGSVGDGNTYEKTGASTWTLRQNLKGPGGPGTGDMLAANNLSDVASITTSRTNLGLKALAIQDTATIAQVDNLQTELDNLQNGINSKIGNVVEDTTPALGGNLSCPYALVGTPDQDFVITSGTNARIRIDPQGANRCLISGIEMPDINDAPNTGQVITYTAAGQSRFQDLPTPGPFTEWGVSPDQTIPNNGALISVAYSAFSPAITGNIKELTVDLVCVTAEHGYTAGMVLPQANFSANAGNRGLQIYYDDTATPETTGTAYVRVGQVGIYVFSSTGVPVQITLNRWALRFKAKR